MIPVAIGIGLIMSLIFSEAFGLAAGGMVVPGYIALALAEPWRVVGPVVAAVLTYLTAKFMLLYGKRFLVMVILLGFLYGHLTRVIFGRPEFPEFLSFEAIGYIIPGLIAYWMDRQGAFVTLMSMLMAAVMVRLVLILTTGGAPIEVPTW
mgnify:CR=1 FL=1